MFIFVIGENPDIPRKEHIKDLRQWFSIHKQDPYHLEET